MIHYADDSITICERQLCEEFKKLSANLQEKSAGAFAILCMNLFYPENSYEDTGPREAHSITDPDSYLNNVDNETKTEKTL